jgi:hypothetical protein
MRKFKIKIKCTQEVTLELPATAYGEDPEVITAEQIADMEEQNVLSDPTYFDSCDNASINVEVDVEEIKDA